MGLRRARRLNSVRLRRACPVWTPQAQASEAEDSFEMSEQHLNLFQKTTGGLVFGRRGESASDVSSILVQITRDLAGDRVRAALPGW